MDFVTITDHDAVDGLAAVRERTWEASLAALGAGWERALAFSPPQPGVAVPA